VPGVKMAANPIRLESARTEATEPRILTVVRERQFTLLLRAFVITGLVFMLLPGTFLGVWNLLSISSHKTQSALSATWVQAHGHAQIFGWIGSFIIGIGFYSLPSGRRTSLRRAWTCWALWMSGVWLRWVAGVYGYQWRVLLPLSAMLELAAFAIFFRSLSAHRSATTREAGAAAARPPAWIQAVLMGTFAFGIALLTNAVVCFAVALNGVERSMPQAFNHWWLTLVVWGFLAPTVFGFTARWGPVFIGTPSPNEPKLRCALALIVAGIVLAAVGWMMLSAGVLALAACYAIAGTKVFARSERPPKTRGVHPSMPFFIRAAYVWLLIASILGILATALDQHNGYWGASRHALTVGFLATMVFTIGPRILPHFSGVKSIYSTRLMFLVLLLLTLGCSLRVTSEVAAYEHSVGIAWQLLPVSAILELVAVTLFAANIFLTMAFSPSTFVNLCFAPERAAIPEN
jgi:uncharacterized protein involved in response to NO